MSLKGQVFEGRLDPPRGWVSTHYGQRRPAPALVYSAVAPLPVRIATLLWPVSAPDEPMPTVVLTESPDGAILQLSMGQDRQLVMLTPNGPVVQRG